MSYHENTVRHVYINTYLYDTDTNNTKCNTVIHVLHSMAKRKTQPITVRLPVKVVEGIDLLAKVHQTDRTTEILRACEIYIEQVKDIDKEEVYKYFDYRKEKEEVMKVMEEVAEKVTYLENEVRELKGD